MAESPSKKNYSPVVHKVIQRFLGEIEHEVSISDEAFRRLTRLLNSDPAPSSDELNAVLFPDDVSEEVNDKD